MAMTGHKTTQMVRRYIREANIFKNNALNKIKALGSKENKIFFNFLHIVLTSLIFNSGYKGSEKIPLDLISEISNFLFLKYFEYAFILCIG